MERRTILKTILVAVTLPFHWWRPKTQVNEFKVYTKAETLRMIEQLVREEFDKIPRASFKNDFREYRFAKRLLRETR